MRLAQRKRTGFYRINGDTLILSPWNKKLIFDLLTYDDLKLFGLIHPKN